MKAFILGAGLGTRLRPLTNVRPKPLVPLFHRPMMQYALDRALALGISEVAINTHHLAEVWEEFFPSTEGQTYQGGNGVPSRSSQYGDAHLSLFHEPELLETGGGIANIADWIGESDVLVYNGDIYCSIPLEPLLELHAQGDYEATLVLRSAGPAQHIAIEGTQVVDIHHKLGQAEGTHQFTGIYCISPQILQRLETNKKESIIRAFLDLAQEGKLGAVVIDEGEWFDLGTREMYLEAHRSESMRPEGVVQSSVPATQSWVAEDVTVGENVTIEGSIIWPGVTIGAEARIVDSIIFSDVPAGSVCQSVDQ